MPGEPTSPAPELQSQSQAHQRPQKQRLSRGVSTWLLGAGGLSAMFVLSGCNSGIQAHSYLNEGQCIAAKVYPEWECRARFDRAQDLHRTAAPQYARLEDCERDYGKEGCGQENNSTSSGGQGARYYGGSYIPNFYGYMLGARGSETTPLYRSSRAQLVTANGVAVSQNTLAPEGGRVFRDSFQRPAQRVQYRQGQSVSQRGGFGASARGRAGG